MARVSPSLRLLLALALFAGTATRSALADNDQQAAALPSTASGRRNAFLQRRLSRQLQSADPLDGEKKRLGSGL